MLPRHRRTVNLTAEQRAEIGDRLRRARKGRRPMVQSDFDERQCVRMPLDDFPAIQTTPVQQSSSSDPIPTLAGLPPKA